MVSTDELSPFPFGLSLSKPLDKLEVNGVLSLEGFRGKPVPGATAMAKYSH
jgi:hypothetical protein